MIRIRCQEVNVKFKFNEGNSQRLTVPYEGAQYFIVERDESYIMVHFCRKGDVVKNIVQKTIIWNTALVFELDMEKIDSVWHSDEEAPQERGPKL